jgi:hypothetical protein
VAPELDIIERDGIATVTLAGADTTVTSLHHRDGQWVVVALDGRERGSATTRAAAVELGRKDWERRFDGAQPCSPTSVTALARELHLLRDCGGYVKRQVNWLCHCNRDAMELNGTQWLKDVVTVLGGTFPDQPTRTSRG